MNIITGNLITLAKEGHFDAIIHGCNCFCNMGAGLAPQIKSHFPCAWNADQRTTKGDKNKLGMYSLGRFPLPQNKFNRNLLLVVNAYTQFGYGRGLDFDYGAFKSVLQALSQDREFEHVESWGFPRIGAGLAGGDWERIEDMILDSPIGEKTTIVAFRG